jgi:peroxiredoxin Q/BCP
MNIGDKAPEILGKDEQGRDIRLSDYKGRKLVLYFYPKDNTSGCTAEACSLRDHYGELQGAGYEVVGVSKDSAASHVKFKEKHELPFPLIADVDKTLMEAMGAAGDDPGKNILTALRIRKGDSLKQALNTTPGSDKDICLVFGSLSIMQLFDEFDLS